jgi:hypothetical protein
MPLQAFTLGSRITAEKLNSSIEKKHWKQGRFGGRPAR